MEKDIELIIFIRSHWFILSLVIQKSSYRRRLKYHPPWIIMKFNIIVIIQLLFQLCFGGYLYRKLEKVSTEDILKTVKTTITACHWECQRIPECHRHGTPTLVNVGVTTTCYLLQPGKRKYDTLIHTDNEMELYVVELVCLSFVCYLLFMKLWKV